VVCRHHAYWAPYVEPPMTCLVLAAVQVATR
jgi:hypothetical protein